MYIKREMLFPLTYYKKAKFTGSKGNMNFRIEKIVEEDMEQFLFTYWKGPECYTAAKTEKIEMKYPFTEAGMEEICNYINEKLKDM